VLFTCFIVVASAQILKDITNRYKLLRGYQINYVPGWDCHGLPIELKAVRDGKQGILTDPIKIRDAGMISRAFITKRYMVC
jgi:isoleucyl-tRNA synthetase